MSTVESKAGKKTKEPRSSKKAAAVPAAGGEPQGLTFFCTECQVRWEWSEKEGAHLCFECGSPFDVVTLGYFDDERVDKDGNFLTGFEPTISVAFSTAHECNISPICGLHGLWGASIDSAEPGSAYFVPANIKTNGASSKEMAVTQAMIAVLRKWEANGEPAGADKRAIAIAELRDFIERYEKPAPFTGGDAAPAEAKDPPAAPKKRAKKGSEPIAAKPIREHDAAEAVPQPVPPGEAGFTTQAPDRLVPSPTNPRKTFDPVQLQDLADSMKDVGLLQPILARRHKTKDGHFEIIAGERRWRAAQLAKLEAVPVVLREMTDAQVLKAQMIENFERQDLNPIEEAMAFQTMTKPIAEGGAGMTQRELAEQFREAGQKKASSQGFIANRIRLLDLPELWQQRVISQEIMTTFAREVLPYAKYPAVLKKLEKKKAETVQDWRREVNRAVEESGRNMRPPTGSWDTNGCQFKAKDDVLEQLDVVEVRYPSGWKQKFAMNVPLWDKLQKEAKEKKKERDQKKLENESKKPKKQTAAETKAAEEKKDQQFGRRLYDWILTLKQRCIAERLGKADDLSILKLILFFSVQSSYYTRANELQEEVDAISGGSRKRMHYGAGDSWNDLGLIERGKLKTLARKLAIKWVGHVANGNADIAPDDVDRIYFECGGDLKQDWRLSKEFLELHNKNQLVELALEWKCKTPELQMLAMKRGELIDHVIEKCGTAKCPKSVWSLNPDKI